MISVHDVQFEISTIITLFMVNPVVKKKKKLKDSAVRLITFLDELMIKST